MSSPNSYIPITLCNDTVCRTVEVAVVSNFRDAPANDSAVVLATNQTGATPAGLYHRKLDPALGVLRWYFCLPYAAVSNPQGGITVVDGAVTTVDYPAETLIYRNGELITGTVLHPSGNAIYVVVAPSSQAGVARGFSGFSGMTGPAGASGYSGYSGAVGPQGVGLSGYSGFSGASGTSLGIKGVVTTSTLLPGWPSSYGGTVGSGYITTDTNHLWVWSGSTWVDAGNIVGPQGASGYSGISGFKGDTGAVGGLGYSGYSGVSGATGATGASGMSGFSGAVGPVGGLGYSGYSGISGVGTSGFSGVSGFSGISGYSGTSGFSGAINFEHTEGPFTPSLTFGGGGTGIMYGTRVGSYTRIGNRVFFEGRIVLTSKGSSMGTVAIGGLPVTPAAHGAYSLQVSGLSLQATVLQGSIVTGVPSLGLTQLQAGISTPLTDANFTATTALTFSGHYSV